MSLLAHMAETSAERARRPRWGSFAGVRAPAPFDRPGLIAEVKLAAPSTGTLQAPADPLAYVVEQAQRYVRAGASAISVLTEPLRFSGDLSYLQAVAEAVDVPVMRKDFLVDPVQLDEAHSHGASMVLLIARMLDDDALQAMGRRADDLGLVVLLEAFDADDLGRSAGFAARHPGTLVGVNTRDLVTLEVVSDRLAQLTPCLPDLPPSHLVAESGIRTAEDARRARAAGYGSALVGSALMQADDPEALAAQLLEALRG
jgi:indole-3-glycerol phosphate synthase